MEFRGVCWAILGWWPVRLSPAAAHPRPDVWLQSPLACSAKEEEQFPARAARAEYQSDVADEAMLSTRFSHYCMLDERKTEADLI